MAGVTRVLLCIATVLASVASDAAAQTVKFEYKVEEIGCGVPTDYCSSNPPTVDASKLSARFAEFGSAGWELTQIYPVGANVGGLTILPTRANSSVTALAFFRRSNKDAALAAAAKAVEQAQTDAEKAVANANGVKDEVVKAMNAQLATTLAADPNVKAAVVNALDKRLSDFDTRISKLEGARR